MKTSKVAQKTAEIRGYIKDLTEHRREALDKLQADIAAAQEELKTIEADMEQVITDGDESGYEILARKRDFYKARIAKLQETTEKLQGKLITGEEFRKLYSDALSTARREYADMCKAKIGAIQDTLATVESFRSDIDGLNAYMQALGNLAKLEPTEITRLGLLELPNMYVFNIINVARLKMLEEYIKSI